MLLGLSSLVLIRRLPNDLIWIGMLLLLLVVINLGIRLRRRWRRRLYNAIPPLYWTDDFQRLLCKSIEFIIRERLIDSIFLGMLIAFSRASERVFVLVFKRC